MHFTTSGTFFTESAPHLGGPTCVSNVPSFWSRVYTWKTSTTNIKEPASYHGQQSLVSILALTRKLQAFLIIRKEKHHLWPIYTMTDH